MNPLLTAMNGWSYKAANRESSPSNHTGDQIHPLIKAGPPGSRGSLLDLLCAGAIGSLADPELIRETRSWLPPLQLL